MKTPKKTTGHPCVSKFISLATVALTLTSLEAATFYVAKNGSDSNNGTSSSPFKSLPRAHDAMSSGDICIVRDGTYWTPLNITKSGLTFRAANKHKATIETRRAVNNWSAVSGRPGEFVANCANVVSDEYMAVYHNNAPQDWARWPNNSDNNEFTFDGVVPGDGTASSLVVSGSPANLNGAYVRYLGGHSGVTWSRKITNYQAVSGGHRTSYTPFDITKWPFRVHNPSVVRRKENGRGLAYYYGLRSLMNGPREWWYDRANSKLYFRPANGSKPANWTVKVPFAEHGAVITGNNVTLDGFKMFGGNVEVRGHNCTVKNNDIQHGFRPHGRVASGTSGSGSVFINGRNSTVTRNTISYGTTNGILATGSATGATLSYNVVHGFNTQGLHAGCIRTGADNATILANRLYDSGRSLVTFFGKNTHVSYNHLSGGMRINADGGMIYTVGRVTSDPNPNVRGDETPEIKNSSVHHNWISWAVTPSYLRNKHYLAPGVYLDNHSSGYHVYDNIIWNIVGSAVQVNWQNQSVWIYHNTAWDIHDYNDNGQYMKGYFFKRWANGYTARWCRSWNNYANTNKNESHGGYWESNNIFENVSGVGNTPFVSLANRNFMPKAGSSISDNARADNRFRDQNAIGANPDVGAYERSGSNWRPGTNARFE